MLFSKHREFYYVGVIFAGTANCPLPDAVAKFIEGLRLDGYAAPTGDTVTVREFYTDGSESDWFETPIK